MRDGAVVNRRPDGQTLSRYGMAGGLCTTATDYTRFLMEVINPRSPPINFE